MMTLTSIGVHICLIHLLNLHYIWMGLIPLLSHAIVGSSLIWKLITFGKVSLIAY